MSAITEFDTNETLVLKLNTHLDQACDEINASTAAFEASNASFTASIQAMEEATKRLRELKDEVAYYKKLTYATGTALVTGAIFAMTIYMATSCPK